MRSYVGWVLVLTCPCVACGSSGSGADSGADAAFDGGGGDVLGSDAPASDAGDAGDAGDASNGDDGGGVGARLFVPDRNPTGVVRGYTLPLSSSSLPVVSLPVSNGTFVAANASTLIVSDQMNLLHAFAQPVTSTSKEYATFGTTTIGVNVLALGPNGALYQGTPAAGILIYSAPFSNSTTSGSSIAVNDITGLGFDASGTLYACDNGTNVYVITGTTVTTTVPAPAGSHCRGVAPTATQLLFADTAGGVFVYALPLTSGSVPVASMMTGLSAPEGDAVDSTGNLYVTNGDNQTVVAFGAPFMDASAPVATVQLPAETILFGIAIGP